MAIQNDTVVLGATQIAIPALSGTAFPYKVQPAAGCVGAWLSRLSGGSLEILPNTILNKTISGATAGNLGYVLASGEIVQIDGPAAFYLAATGATAVAQIGFKFGYLGATLG